MFIGSIENNWFVFVVVTMFLNLYFVITWFM